MNDADEPVLKSANDNSWYCLATLYGEQPERSPIDEDLATRVRLTWNRWMAGDLTEDRRKADFNSTIFSYYADFKSVTFSREAEFINAVFSDRTIFSDARFKGLVPDFRGAEMHDASELHGVYCSPKHHETKMLHRTESTLTKRLKQEMERAKKYQDEMFLFFVGSCARVVD